MSDEFKEQLIDAVKAAVEVLSDDEALEIVRICGRATDRKIADITEQYIAERIAESDSIE